MTHSILLQEYMQKIEPTDLLHLEDKYPIVFGLFGEVGSVMSVVKKYRRENLVDTEYKRALEEEFGDVLWYFTTLCRRLGIRADDLFSEIINQDEFENIIGASDLAERPLVNVAAVRSLPTLEETLTKLGEAASTLLDVNASNASSEQIKNKLREFSYCYISALQAASVNFSEIVHKSIKKSRGRFLEPDIQKLPTFDSKFSDEEKLPMDFEIRIVQRKSGQCYLQWNGVFIGDPLMDNMRDSDGYRFHDVFHLAHAAILHWSPTFRALIKQKRKSDRKVDETQDSGRARVVEEGLTAWIFSRAKHLKFFEGQSSVSFDMLKTVQQFVQGYEVEACPLKLWEEAILKGYKVFRQVRRKNGGIVIGNRQNRTITYKLINGN